VRTVVITPTYRWGGLGEQYACLLHQTHRIHAWVIADDLYDERADIVKMRTANANFDVIHYKPPPKPQGFFSDIGGLYNQLLDTADDLDAQLIVSLQDHFWVPNDGIARFVEATILNPGALVTGLASLALTPGPDRIGLPEGKWTLFPEQGGGGWPDKPGPEMWWEDVRIGYYPDEGRLCRSNPVEWELNWASIPGEHVSAGTRFDPEYGRGISLENHDFAWQCFLDHDSMVILDKENHAIGFPHKLYWPEQVEEGLPMTEVNREYHLRKWNSVLSVMNMGKL